jgi:hypothetical protein
MTWPKRFGRNWRVVAVHKELRDVIDLEWAIEDRDWGRRELVVRDPSGYFLTFAEDTSEEPTSM